MAFNGATPAGRSVKHGQNVKALWVRLVLVVCMILSLAGLGAVHFRMAWLQSIGHGLQEGVLLFHGHSTADDANSGCKQRTGRGITAVGAGFDGAPIWQRVLNEPMSTMLKDFARAKMLVEARRWTTFGGPQKDNEPQDFAGLDWQNKLALEQRANASGLDGPLRELREGLTDAVLAYIHGLQWPRDCTSTKKLVCSLNKGCGFGCQLHHATHCFANAVALNRTLLLQVNPWSYGSWPDVLQPVTGCPVPSGNSFPKISRGGQHNKSADTVFLDIIDSSLTPWDPVAMPQDVMNIASIFHARPEVWYVGLLVNYLLRPSQQSIARHAEFRAQNAWGFPLVGVHVRRTDKIGSEAQSYPVEQYMGHVERFCELVLPSGWQSMKRQLPQAPTPAEAGASDHGANATAVAGSAATAASSHRRALRATVVVAAGSSTGKIQNGTAVQQSVQGGAATAAAVAAPAEVPLCAVYLATDEPAVAAEARSRFPHIHVITNEVGFQNGATNKRYSQSGLLGVYDDIMHLAAADVIVGTFSSQVSRLAFEVMQHKPDTTDHTFHYHSIDAPWYFGGQNLPRMCSGYDYTQHGKVVVPKGAELTCPVVLQYSLGLVGCQMTNGGHVQLPAGYLRRCWTPARVGPPNILGPELQNITVV